MTRALVLAGTRSGCGKTSVCLGLLRALARRGLRVQPFKAGPDFIDPGLHAAAAGRESCNLDTWMMPEPAVRECFARLAAGADVAVLEGVMGLFDGRGGAVEEGSTAHLAKLLDLPVILVLDAASKARSLAAEALGFARFDPGLRFLGCLANRVASPRHEQIVREAMGLAPELPLLGCLRRDEAIGLGSRHLGLVTAQDAADLDVRLEALADWVEQSLDLDALVASLPGIADLPVPADAARLDAPKGARVGVARDRAFCFCYAENLRLLAAAGAELAFFSPLADAALPEGLDGLYLPGGYPELAARELADNAAMRAAVRGFCAAGRPVWAECGGYMYLLETLVDGAGTEQPMCGALPGRARMCARRAALGYRQARTLAPGPLGPAGTVLRGHEFHYSEAEGTAGARPAFLLAGAGGETSDGQASGNVIGGYFHAHLASNPAVAAAFVAACRRDR
jgi:cobyrinic acid a,c-diamide synthase